MCCSPFHIHMTATLSPQFVAARDAFAAWYDALDSDKRELVDSIAERTYYITESEEYLSFIDMLYEEFGITTAIDFEDRFEAEFEGYGDNQLAEYAENMINECGYLDRVPDMLRYAIDYELLWNGTLRFDYSEVQFQENTYLFRVV